MNRKDARELGKRLGAEFVNENSEFLTEIDPDTDELWTPEGLASSTFDSYQQFSPWEFTAAEFNKSRDPDGLWNAFHEGMDRGARDAAEYREASLRG